MKREAITLELNTPAGTGRPQSSIIKAFDQGVQMITDVHQTFNQSPINDLRDFRNL